MKNSGNFSEKSYQIQRKLSSRCFNFLKEIFKRENLEMTVKLGMTHAQLIASINSDIDLIKDQGSKIITKEFPASGTETSSVQLDTKCQSKDYMFVFMDYGILEPSKYSLSANGLTVNFSPAIPANHKIIIRYFTPGSSFTNYVTDEFQSNLLNYTTNRILEIPQEIKWRTDLVETGKKRYRLTILKGSVYYVPQGFEADGVTRKFSKRTMIADNTCLDRFWSDDALLEEFVFLVFEDNEAILTSSARAGSNITSGDTAPTTFLEQRALWYDTKNNYVKFTNDSGATWHNCSLPLLKGSPRNTIDETHPIAGWVNGPTQVFNGFGYIGSTIFALPGIKYLVGNGRNPDGSCITKIEESTKVNIYTINANRQNNKIVLYNSKLDVRLSLWFDEHKNMCYNNAPVITAYQPTAILGTFSTETTSPWNIKEFNPLGVDSLANSNASNFSKAGESYLSSLSMPSNKYIDLTLCASGSTYTAPATGLFTLSVSYSTGGYMNMYVAIGERYGYFYKYDANVWVDSCLVVKKGAIIIIQYQGTATVHTFKFIYAEGDQ